MTKKIVAIGGGENGRVKSDGTQAHTKQDQWIKK